jgi:tetratricopeptide (TPR) repeat protein
MNADELYRHGNQLAFRGDQHGALALLDRALQADPRHRKAYGNRGGIKAQLGDYAGAIADLDAAIRLRPGDSLAYSNRGLAKGHLGDWKGALEDSSLAVGVNPQDAAAYLNRADALVQLGRGPEAVRDLDEAERLSDNATLRAVAARIRAKIQGGAVAQEQPDEAEAAYRRSDYAAARDAASHLWRGAARLKLGDEQGAIADYDRGLALLSGPGRRELQNGWEMFRAAGSAHPAVLALIDWIASTP